MCVVLVVCRALRHVDACGSVCVGVEGRSRSRGSSTTGEQPSARVATQRASVLGCTWQDMKRQSILRFL